MILYMIAVRDVAQEVFLQPSPVRARGAALRDFQEQVRNPESILNKHANDFELWQIGLWDDETGEFQAGQERLMRGADVQQPGQDTA